MPRCFGWIRRAALLCGLLVAGAQAAARDQVPVLPSPVRATGVEGAGMAYVALDLAGYSAARAMPAARWTGFPLGPGRRVDLDLEQFQVLSEDATVVIAGDGAERAMPRPEVVLLRGEVAGAPGSRAYLGLSPGAMNGFVLVDGRTYVVSSGPPTGVQPAVVYDAGEVPRDLLRLRDWVCGTDGLGPVPGAPRGGGKARPHGAPGGADGPSCAVARVALDTDYEFSGVFGGNTTNSAAYALALMGAVSEIYRRDFNAALEVGYLRVWAANTDPYSSTTVNDRLTELLNHWNANMGSIPRVITHLLSGVRGGAGGVAYLGVLCHGTYGYGASGYLDGHFPYPVVNNNGQNWDLMVVAHEIGHNFGSPHTHDMTPRIDGCGSDPQDCTNANLGTIMSYCHTCAGGMANMRLEFHARTISEAIAPYLAGLSGCLQTRSAPVIDTQPAPLTLAPGGSAQFTAVVSGGTPITYAWRKFGVTLTNNGHYSGVTTPTLTISPLVAADTGSYSVRIANACGVVFSTPAGLSITAPCYANCDESTTEPVLSVLDFSCFLNRFAAGDAWANCDQSSTPPVLNVLDFSCFLNRFAAGCGG